jgi:hypothetical protein
MRIINKHIIGISTTRDFPSGVHLLPPRTRFDAPSPSLEFPPVARLGIHQDFSAGDLKTSRVFGVGCRHKPSTNRHGKLRSLRWCAHASPAPYALHIASCSSAYCIFLLCILPLPPHMTWFYTSLPAPGLRGGCPAKSHEGRKPTQVAARPRTATAAAAEAAAAANARAVGIFTQPSTLAPPDPMTTGAVSSKF